MANTLSASSKVSFVQRTITALIFMAVLIPCTIFGELPYFLMCLFISVVAIHEFLVVPGANKYGIITKLIVYGFVLSFTYWSFIKNWAANPSNSPFVLGRFAMSDLFVSISAMFTYLLVLFILSIYSPKIQLNDVTYLFTMGVIIGFGTLGMYFLRYYPNSNGLIYEGETVIQSSTLGNVTASNYFQVYYQNRQVPQQIASCLLMFFVIIGTWMSDVGAYLVGMLFGKHRMNPRISPHKTWEGFFGGVVFDLIFSLGFAAVMEKCFGLPLIPGLLQFSNSEIYSTFGIMNGNVWPFLVIISFLLPFVGNIGGFLFSLIKRQFGLKDFGNILPGHGGMIDRFDSIFINSFFVGALVVIIANGWSFLV